MKIGKLVWVPSDIIYQFSFFILSDGEKKPPKNKTSKTPVSFWPKAKKERIKRYDDMEWYVWPVIPEKQKLPGL